jgi:hypothetical protein
VNYVGAPVVTSTKLLLPITMAGVGGQINLGSFDIGTAAWTMQPTGAGVAVAVTSSGDAVIAFGGRSTQYAWTKRTAAGAWSSSQVIAGVGVSSFFGQAPVPVLVKRANVDEIVGLFVTEATNKTTLDATTFSGGAWSAPTPIATDLLVSFGPERPMAAAALPDGRVAIAYLVGAPGLGKAIKVGFLSGATWGPFDAVPGVSAAHGAIDLALAPGTDGAMLEMVYVDSAYALRHTRLTAGGTWTLPTTIDTSRSYAFVSLVTL